MDIKFNELKYKDCGAKLNLCEGDILQLIQECLDCLLVACELCGGDNFIAIENIDFKIKHV